MDRRAGRGESFGTKQCVSKCGLWRCGLDGVAGDTDVRTAFDKWYTLCPLALLGDRQRRRTDIEEDRDGDGD